MPDNGWLCYWFNYCNMYLSPSLALYNFLYVKPVCVCTCVCVYMRAFMCVYVCTCVCVCVESHIQDLVYDEHGVYHQASVQLIYH